MGLIKMKYVTVLLVLAVVRGTDAATHVVGDSLGWTIPTGGAATYTTWAAKNTFGVGDILVFNYAAGAHDVATVTKDSFDSCSSTSPLALQTIPPANVTLTTKGEHYFICTFSQHCSLGQKLTVNVTSTSAGPPAATPAPTAATPPPTAATPSSPPTAASPTTPPPVPSPTTPPTAPAPSPTTPPTAPAPMTPATSPAPKGSAPAPGPTAGGRPTPAASPGPGGSTPVPTPAGSTPVPTPAVGGGPTPPPSPTPATPPGSSTSPPPPPSSASRKAVATLAIGLLLAIMGVVC